MDVGCSGDGVDSEESARRMNSDTVDVACSDDDTQRTATQRRAQT